MQRLLLTIVALLASAPALAQAPVIEERDGANGCWRRQYDAAHLAAHPDQQVTAMSLALVYRDRADGYPYYAYTLDVALRNGRKGAASSTCDPMEGKLRCSVECDGGGVDVSRRDDGNVRVDLEAVGYIVLTGGCGSEEEEETFELTSGLDDKLFLLHAVDAKQCKAMLPDW
ncbi:MAG: hypothetical protein ABS75_05385 [Pelagibacterium sp. SCN 63-23]|nr:MAG: hypothetical protein ABS75_05385 [Pelagibacterium sp. SCN 63-23]